MPPLLNRIERAFGTPMLHGAVPGAASLNPGLRSFALALRAGSPARTASAPCAWQSDTDMWDGPAASCVPELAALNAALAAACDELARDFLGDLAPGWDGWEGRAWFTVFDAFDYAAPHAHGRCDWAGVYYVDAGAPPPGPEPWGGAPRGVGSGELRFIDPGSALPAHGEGPFGLGADRVRVVPEAGRFVLWPGPLWHWVVPYAPAGAHADPASVPPRISYAVALRHRFRGPMGSSR